MKSQIINTATKHVAVKAYSQINKKEIQLKGFILDNLLIIESFNFFHEESQQSLNSIIIQIPQCLGQLQTRKTKLKFKKLSNLHKGAKIIVINIERETAQMINIQNCITLNEIIKLLGKMKLQISSLTKYIEKSILSISQLEDNLISNLILKFQELQKKIQILLPSSYQDILSNSNSQISLTLNYEIQQIQNMSRKNSLSLDNFWDIGTPYISKFDINKGMVTKNSSGEQWQWYQITGLQPILQQSISTFKFKVHKYGEFTIGFGIITQSRKLQQQNSCPNGAVCYNTWPNPQSGAILIDEFPVLKMNKDVFVDIGYVLVMIVDLKNQLITFHNSFSGKDFVYSLCKQHWSSKNIYPYVSMMKDGDCIELIEHSIEL